MDFLKRIKSGLIPALALMMCAPTGVYAAEPTYTTTSATIDYSKKGSITLYKYVDNNGQSIDASGINYVDNSADMLAAVRQQVGDDDILPEKGVHFKALKIADIDQVSENTVNGINVTGTYYTKIDNGFFNLIKKYLGNNYWDGIASESTRITDGRDRSDTASTDDHYESDDLNTTILTMNRMAANAGAGLDVTGEVALNDYIRSNSSHISFDDTDVNGYTSINNLDLGLYLICETDYEHSALSKHDTYFEQVVAVDGNTPGLTEDANNHNSGLTAGGNNAGGSQYADIASPTSPFLISIPMTNVADIKGADGVTHIAGTVWQYDVTAYPKNGTINIHKDIVTNDFAGTTDGGTILGAMKGVDGNDEAADETLCDMVQTNYLPTEADGGTSDMVDGALKTGLTHQIDANIGDTVTQLITVDVPRLVDDIDNEQPTDQANHATTERKHNKTFIVTDTMTKGLKLIDQQSFKVTLTAGAWNDYGADTITFVNGTDFNLQFNLDKQQYVLTVLQPGLEKMDDISCASYLYIRYDVEVTKDALVGTDTYGNQRIVTKSRTSTEQNVEEGNLADQLVIDNTKTDVTYTNENGVSHPEAGNQNTAKLTYATSRTMDHDYYSNTTRVYTYEIDLTKTFTDGTRGGGDLSTTKADGANLNAAGDKNTYTFDYSQVKFTVRGSVDPDSEHANTSNDSWEQMIWIRTGDGTYRVWDKYTDGGNYDAVADTLEQDSSAKLITKYITPNSQTGLMTLIGVDARQYEFTEVATATGRNLMADKFFVELHAPVVGGKTLENGVIEHAYLWSDETAKMDLVQTAVNKARMDEGRVPFTVQNNEIIKVLKTGGVGTVAFVVCGGVAIVGCGLFLIKKKREEDEADLD